MNDLFKKTVSQIFQEFVIELYEDIQLSEIGEEGVLRLS